MLSAFFSTSMLTASDVMLWAALVAACTAGVLEMFTRDPLKQNGRFLFIGGVFVDLRFCCYRNPALGLLAPVPVHFF